ncbi:hypothetical protein [Nocardioides sp. InS609-2]|uniref:hypothetical protein n=1 Tax=Nocardioides sp. InS609-2 TaxID=2760705 RepID=UPI0020BE7ED9|nr:hypothetical protein [Nocardioides sp. InS609-2]
MTTPASQSPHAGGRRLEHGGGFVVLHPQIAPLSRDQDLSVSLERFDSAGQSV